MSRPRATSAEMEAAFPIGSQVRLSGRGRGVLSPRDPSRIGTVVGYAWGGPPPHTISCVKVRWPGCKGATDLHRDFVELAGGSAKKEPQQLNPNTIRIRRMAAAHAALGLCAKCSEPCWEGLTTCFKHSRRKHKDRKLAPGPPPKALREQ